MSKKCGIYKITSPTGRIYIGQSVDSKRRWLNYNILLQTISQPKLHLSFKKHGVKNHTFEVIEECESEQLNIRERFWQDEFDVVKKGLNCMLTSTNELPYVLSQNSRDAISESKKGGKNPNAKDVLDPYIGIYYESTVEVSLLYCISIDRIQKMLRGSMPNKTNLIYADDYEKGLLPNTLYIKKEVIEYRSKKGCEVVNYKTKEIEGSLSQVANSVGISKGKLKGYLAGTTNNPTNYIFKRDFDKGLKPEDLRNNRKPRIKVINFITKEIFKSSKEASLHYNVDKRTISKCLNNLEKSLIPLMRIIDFDENVHYTHIVK